MTQREKYLSIVLLTTFLVVGVGFGGYLFLLQPLWQLAETSKALKTELEDKEGELARKEEQVATITRTSPRLAMWKKISLPVPDPRTKKPNVSAEEHKNRHVAQMQIEYERFLSELLSRNGFAHDSIIITPRPPAGASNTQRGKQPVFDRLAFGVTARGKLDGLVQMLDDFHRANLLHQIRTLSLTTVLNRSGRGPATPTGELDLGMSVEVLLANGADTRTALMPSSVAVKTRVLAEPGRDYKDLAARDIFQGVVANAKISEDRTEVLRFVRLTTLYNNGRRWEAYLYDLGKGGEERRVNTVTLDEFSVEDKYGNLVLDARVVHIDHRALIFKTGKKFYRLEVGDFLHPALEKPLSAAELKALAISPES
jgi:hypothetical protein